jgi:Na+/H+ antiporter NhaD/arsenite permease-like protein
MNSFYITIPFILMLLCIAIIPLLSTSWWHKNFPKVCLVIGLPVAIAVMFINWHWLFHTLIDYAAFITLLASLFIISGGILLKENLRISAMVNTLVLLMGAVLSNFIGTTGASMLLIRPLIRLNKERSKKTHIIIFFIFIVGNIGGSLTPLGDPPLFLGFLQGVPFLWTLKLLPAWIINNGLLLLVFFIIDSFLLKNEHPVEHISHSGAPVKILGKRNFIFLAGVIAAIITYAELPQGMNIIYKNLIQISIMALMATLSWKYTPKKHRIENGFTWFPIKEIAILFAAIFITMIPALKLLQTKGVDLGVTEPYQFFWGTGLLSSFLDNAPTYLSFLSLGKSIAVNTSTISLVDGTIIGEKILIAISMGAVFMGANTYIGNGPNFMIKSVAEESGIKMPSFFKYMLWALCILIPLFILNTFIFFL